LPHETVKRLDLETRIAPLFPLGRRAKKRIHDAGNRALHAPARVRIAAALFAWFPRREAHMLELLFQNLTAGPQARTVAAYVVGRTASRLARNKNEIWVRPRCLYQRDSSLPKRT
jgi:hypothetical protein